MNGTQFVGGMVIAVGLAYFFPDLDHYLAPVSLQAVIPFAIGLIFFFYGLKLSGKAIVKGLKNWRLHILIQVATFVLFPLIVLTVYPFVQDGDGFDLWMGFFFLAALPSTVSSSVVMVSLAKGNIPAAIFNASISGLIGIALTPLWIGIFIDNRESFQFAEVYKTLALEILCPLALGLLVNRYLNQWAVKNSRVLSTFDQSVILLIVYQSFASSFGEGLFENLSWATLLTLVVGVILLFFVMFGLLLLLGRTLKFNREDRITTLFCGSKKSLTHGTVFSQALFAQSASLGLLLLPLMIFHAFQILMISFIAQKTN